jgi:hypothetical protein
MEKPMQKILDGSREIGDFFAIQFHLLPFTLKLSI